MDCGCDIIQEGGFGDDGRHWRYSVDPCPTHGAAERMERLLRHMLKADIIHADALAEARAIIAEIDQYPPATEPINLDQLDPDWLRRGPASDKEGSPS